MRFLGKVGGVGLAGIFVPVGGEDALRARAFKREPETADAAEEINEFEFAPHPVPLPIGWGEGGAAG